MPEIQHAKIYTFGPKSTLVDDDGEVMIGSYYQFIDSDDQPTGHLIGPYGTNQQAEKAAHRAFMRGDV